MGLGVLMLYGVDGLNGDFWDRSGFKTIFLGDLLAIVAFGSLRCSFVRGVYVTSTHGWPLCGWVLFYGVDRLNWGFGIGFF